MDRAINRFSLNFLWSGLGIRTRILSGVAILMVIAISCITLILEQISHTQAQQRVERYELPSSVDRIANQLTAELTHHLTEAQALASNSFVIDWLAQGMPAAEWPKMEHYFQALQQRIGGNVFIAPLQTNTLINFSGGPTAQKQLHDSDLKDDWFYGFLKRKHPYELNLDISDFDKRASLYINTAVTAEGKTLAVAGEACQQAQSIQELTNVVAIIGDNAEQIASRSMGVNEVTHHIAGHMRTIEQDVTQSANRLETLRSSISTSSTLLDEVVKDSNDITQIMNLIRDVSNQTNLLALNAAIEAARAGDMGRGFAVVADEVRQLAVRTQTATKDVQDLILRLQEGTRQASNSMTDSRTLSEEGYNRMSQAKEVLIDATSQINQAALEINEISTLAQSQHQQMGQAKAALDELAMVAEHQREHAEESNAASRELFELAKAIDEQIRQYRIR
ncbi:MULTISPECIES: methyl-accepting chemotaxis protein [Aeromonas]|uniref:methyl-accepting chemotaxis protein n=1 Tax=Aeromonas TaxID=642 RepID=UPI002A75B59F|nr:methyl-accepting chemotaxis protein [Aeromonas jandaei]